MRDNMATNDVARKLLRYQKGNEHAEDLGITKTNPGDG